MARAGGTAVDRTMVGAGSTAKVDGWIIESRDDVKANLPDLAQCITRDMHEEPGLEKAVPVDR